MFLSMRGPRCPAQRLHWLGNIRSYSKTALRSWTGIHPMRQTMGLRMHGRRLCTKPTEMREIMNGSAMVFGLGLTFAGYSYYCFQSSSLARSKSDDGKPKLEDNYEKGNVIGYGHFAIVHKGKSIATGQEVAIKEITKRRTDKIAFRREVETLRKVQGHKNVVQLYDVYETHDKWYLVMELVTGGEMFERLVQKGAYSEQTASRLVHQICEAIAFLHAQGVCHRDLKPENLLVSSFEDDGDVTIKICDFGLAVAMEGAKIKEDAQGTWAYWAPELFRGADYGPEVDLWSLGVILFVLLSGRHPFDNPRRTQQEMQQRIKAVNYGFDHPVWSNVSEDAKQLICNLLNEEPAKRPTAQSLLQHKWVVGTGVSEKLLPESDKKLGEFISARRKWNAALVSSIHKTAMLKRRITDEYADEEESGNSSESNMLEDAFKMFDADNKGYISLEDIKKALETMGQNIDERQLQDMITMAEKNDGRLNYDDYMKMADGTTRKHFQKGQQIFRAGEEADFFYLITSGQVSILFKDSTHGSNQHMQQLHPGDFFGTSALLSKFGKRNGTAVAISDVNVIALNRDDFDELTKGKEGRTSTGGKLSASSRTHSVTRSIRFIQMMTDSDRRKFGNGEIIYKQGDPASMFYVIDSGKVEVSHDDEVLSHRGPGECCGEQSAMSGAPHSATVRCVEPAGCEMCGVSRRDFLELIKSSWDIREDVGTLAKQHIAGVQTIKLANELRNRLNETSATRS